MSDLFTDPFLLTEDMVAICPNCSEYVIIAKINCQIFRHASYKINGEQIPPHTSQAECEALIASQSIYGCGKPFRIIKNENNENSIVVCGYI